MTTMTTYEPADWRPEPGDVAEVAHQFRAEDAVFGADKKWHSISPGNIGALLVNPSRVRHLPRVDPASTVVLDPDNPDDVQRFREAAYAYSKGGLVTADSALRSLLPAVTPPEPNGLGAVVEDDEGDVLLRDHYGRWLAREQVEEPGFDWDDLTVTRIVSHGAGCSCGAPDCNGGSDA